MKESVGSQQQHIYMPAVVIQRATLKYSWSKIPVSTVAHPDQICGEARRIGYTGKLESDLALYRLKIKMSNGQQTVTLPCLYLIKDGIFQDYEQWQKDVQLF